MTAHSDKPLSYSEMPSYLHSDWLPGLLPVEDAADLELWFQRVLLDGGFHGAALAADDHIGVGACVETRKRLISTSCFFFPKLTNRCDL